MTDRRPRLALLPSHPAQFWIMHALAPHLEAFAEPVWVVRDKDILLQVADRLGIQYHVLSQAQSGLLRNGTTLLRDVLRARKLQRELDIDLWFTKYGAACMAAKLTGRAAVAFNDDDVDIVPLIAWTAYPFARTVLCPDTTRMGRFDKRTTRFAGNFELVYLHPARFTADANALRDVGIDAQQPFALIRLSALTAHHDIGIKGVSESFLRELIALCENRVRLFISSEKPLSAEFEAYRLPIAPHHIHQVMAQACFVVGDSQTMTVESAMVGTPALRISSFVGRLSYIDEVERYQLAHGYKPGDEANALKQIASLIENTSATRETYRKRLDQFIGDKGDPLPTIVECLRNVVEGIKR